jgi:hypothetical protein
VPSDYRFVGWGDRGQEMLLSSTTPGPDYSQGYATYTMIGGRITPLATYTHDYLWGN